ncbi:tetratricopeptide repeat protein [Actinopolymorpha pittospori]|uniref:Tetratricopeptide (TPR) repeat protein n=1 Tax=Actinopolymorpha pittospori TaxID=648752 RepID=A0A927MTW1_9ACTN|nr:tetratricopeptide repeat protein [Actinopolymorpha pittospori]MBE1603235.1 tetratricopeptide (TPR) repeat protein [Actinopolymorpha pittospori]
MSAEDRIENAKVHYERSIFGGDASGLPIAERELDGVEADLALARGRILHARFFEKHEKDPRELALFERAAELYRALGDLRSEGEARFWIGTYHQVVERDNDAGISFFEAAEDLASRAGDLLTRSYALRHLAYVSHMAGRLDAARERMEESTELRRKLGFLPGVAANLVGLAYIAAAQGDRVEALAFLDEAQSTAEGSGAHGIMRQVEEARAEI